MLLLVIVILENQVIYYILSRLLIFGHRKVSSSYEKDLLKKDKLEIWGDWRKGYRLKTFYGKTNLHEIVL